MHLREPTFTGSSFGLSADAFVAVLGACGRPAAAGASRSSAGPQPDNPSSTGGTEIRIEAAAKCYLGDNGSVNYVTAQPIKARDTTQTPNAFGL